ncbi:uncharacterized protein LOC123263028 [Cotesia glomerata]|uniref:Uncharacterized protein n=1 Tax=Cotesia glomerata TaxID=32391 RepID=A0AAV7ISN9_COTGL|nr:uncharacterized protein LOC123263028 [Cotesia glomerata]KAH0567829.1 hypothetical protein KQX54_014611 [Cotesia glomerata]
MSAQSFIDKFTTDEEVGGWTAGDETIKFHGYVDAIEGLTHVATATNPRTPLYKITVNNGSNSRVRVLFWAELAKKYSALINYRVFISIVGAKSKINGYISPKDVVCKLCLVIQSSTDITISSLKYENQYTSGTIELKAIEDLEDVNAIVDVKGFLKQEFRQASSYGGSYASGVLVDKKVRLPLRVIGFNVADIRKFPKGCYLKVRGTAVTPTDGPTQMRVDSLDGITRDSDVIPLTPDELRVMGITSPKRKYDFDDSENKKRFAELHYLKQFHKANNYNFIFECINRFYEQC